jgi:hypothetical protein
LYKGYFDTSFFESVKKLIPARSKLFSGILIEPSIIERNKYENKPIQSSNVDSFLFSPSKPIYQLTSSLIQSNVAKLVSTTPTKSKIYYEKNKCGYISNDAMGERLSAFSTNGTYYSFYPSDGFVTKFIYKIKYFNYDLNFKKSSKKPEYVTSSMMAASFSKSSNLSNTFDFDYDMYPNGHYSTIRNGNRNVFITTKDNTVDENGNLDGSSPITLTSTNQQESPNLLVET